MTHDGKVQEIVDKKLKRIADNIEKELKDMPTGPQNSEEEILEAAIHAAAWIVMRSIREEIE